MKKVLTILTICSATVLTACGEPAPAAWNANLDISCKPHDPYDKLYASLSPEKFWREQEYDMGTMDKAGRKNIEMSKMVLDDSRAQKGDYFQRAQQAARDLGLTGSAKRNHVKENMDRYNQEVKDIEMRLKQQETALNWVRKCKNAVDTELRKLGLQPVKYDPEKRPM
ncbi:hypothetical protein [Terasakiella sp. SH-1]|uniref:hypothetical protein n=1 Tax=Terasakiella sp. SH-1 TaxID=2560057 RepID=UPI0010746D9E|nr:hypothetical protein [Terasakiella sp. SH-1]